MSDASSVDARESDDSPLTLAEASERHGISAPTLRRLCDTGQLRCTREGRGWRVRASDVERYLLTRRPPGNPATVVRLEGPAPNPRLRDAIGWVFSVAVAGTRSQVSIWLTNDLVATLTDEHDVRELVVGAAEVLVQEALLEREHLPLEYEITLVSRDRATLLRAAGAGPEYYTTAEAPIEAGVVIRREFGALDFARDALWPGDTLADTPAGYEDVVVETWTAGARRYVRTVRVALDASADRRRASMVRSACDAYLVRCARTGQRPASWLPGVVERVEALNLAQQRVLQTTYEFFDEHGEWPTFKHVAAILERDYEIDIEEVLPALPRQYLYGYPEGYRPDERVILSIAGLAQCSGAGPDVDLYMQVLRWLVDRRRVLISDPETSEQDLRVASGELAHVLPDSLEQPDIALRKIYQLLQQEMHVWTSMGTNGVSSWSMTLAPAIRRYRGLSSFGEYLEKSGRLDPQPSLWRSAVGTGLTAQTLAWLTQTTSRESAARSERTTSEAVGTRPDTLPVTPTIFVLMPFASAFDDVYRAVKDACTSLGPSLNARCYRADDISTPGRITQQIVDAIREADLIIADMTNNNSNVLFEVGYADALDKPIIALNQEIDAAPFDIRDWRQLSYSIDELADLRKRLVASLLETLPTR